MQRNNRKGQSNDQEINHSHILLCGAICRKLWRKQNKLNGLYHIKRLFINVNAYHVSLVDKSLCIINKCILFIWYYRINRYRLMTPNSSNKVFIHISFGFFPINKSLLINQVVIYIINSAYYGLFVIASHLSVSFVLSQYLLFNNINYKNSNLNPMQFSTFSWSCNLVDHMPSFIWLLIYLYTRHMY